MTKKDFAAKLSEGVRRARHSPATNAGSPAPAAPKPQSARVVVSPDPSRSSTLDRPWDNLHPERIWPD